MGLSMGKDQVVNTSIDGTERKRALIPFQLLNATMWHDQLNKEKRRARLQAQREGLKAKFITDLHKLESKINLFD
jgi:hypothetical protein